MAVFRIYVNEFSGRVLVSGKESDLELIEKGWKIVREFNNWKDAFNYALDIADRFDYVLEWYVDEVN